MDERDDLLEGFQELQRYERGEEIRAYYVRVAPSCLELWRSTVTAGSRPNSVKEADLTSSTEALELLSDIKRSLQAGGWREVPVVK